ncbi:MAG: AbrB/MazE/SpoVT family DNA-binding domain-containing protein [Verrucomicrobiota bacterium]
MKVTTKGQVTIPLHIRKFLGISAQTEVDFDIQGDQVILRKQSSPAESENKFRRLRGILKNNLSTDDILKATRGEDWS